MDDPSSAKQPTLRSLPVLLNKRPEKVKKEDIVKYVRDNDIEVISFRHIGGDGKLKQLDFPVSDTERLENILTAGERVDGSSLFGNVGTTSSDLYIVPDFGTGFTDSFGRMQKLNFLCNYFDSTGNKFDAGPRNVVGKSEQKFLEETGLELHTLAELEFYTIHRRTEEEIFPSLPQSNYHQSLPFARGEDLRIEILRNLANAGLDVKYGHAEVGNIPDSFGKRMVQHELEFLLAPLGKMADRICLAKWVIRRLAYEHNVEVSFSPKLQMGHAGSSIHVHNTVKTEDGKSVILSEKNQELSDIGQGVISGLLENAGSLCAFGNRAPSSYFRLVPGQEAPIKICWGEGNRSALVRIPRLWNEGAHLTKKLDQEGFSEDKKERILSEKQTQTIEIRSPDGTAHSHYLMAALGVAILQGILSEGSSEIVGSLKCESNVYDEKGEGKDFESLPKNCSESAGRLEENRSLYEDSGVFPSILLDNIIDDLREKENPAEKDQEALNKTLDRYLHYG